MKQGKTKRLFITMIFTVAAMSINYVTNFITTPLITNNIGIESYGFVSLAKTFVNYAMIISTALNSYATRYISFEYHKGSKEKANSYCSSVFFGDLILGAIIAIVAAFGIINLDKLLNISPEIVTEVKYLFLLIFLNFFIVTMRPAIEVAAFIKNRLDITAIFRGISYSIEVSCLVALFTFFNPHIWYVSLSTFLSSIFLFIVNYNLTSKLVPDLKISIKYCRLSAIKEIIFSGIWYSINSLGNMLQNGLDLIISNKMLTVLAMGQLSVAKQISNMFNVLFQTIAQIFQPTLMKTFAEKKIDQLVNEFKFAIKINGLISNLLVAGFIAVGTEFYHRWIPGQAIDIIYKITVITIIGDMIVGAVTPLYYVYILTVKIKVPSIVTLSTGGLNLISKYILLTHTGLGVYSVVSTTTVITILTNLIFGSIYSAHCLKISKTTFIPILIKHIFSCIIMIFTFNCFVRIFIISSWGKLIIIVGMCCLIGTVIHGIIMFSKEDLFKILKKINGKITINK